jgi:excisionase family DNA binding protein
MAKTKSNRFTAAIAPLRVGIPEAARILGVSRSRIYLRLREGSLACVKEGGRTLIAISEIEAYVARTNAVGGVRTTTA